MKTVPEPDAELLSAEDVLQDEESLKVVLEQRRAERWAYGILNNPNVKEMLNKLIASSICANEKEAIEKGLRTLLTATNSESDTSV